jgi:hypothetical protein
VSIEGLISRLKHGRAMLSLYLPGEYPKRPGRGDKDGMDEASFTMLDWKRRSRLILDNYNEQPVPEKDMPLDALAAGIHNISRRGLFLWSLERRSGGATYFSKEEEITYLMQAGRARVATDGIHFGSSQIYDSDPRDFDRRAFLSIATSPYVEARFDNLAGHFIYIRSPFEHRWVMALNQNEEYRRLRYSHLQLDFLSRKYREGAEELNEVNQINQELQAKALNREARQKEKEARESRKGKAKGEKRSDIRARTAMQTEFDRAGRAARQINKYQASQGIEEPAEEGSTKRIPNQQSQEDVRKPVQSESVDQIASTLWRKRNARKHGS